VLECRSGLHVLMKSVTPNAVGTLCDPLAGVVCKNRIFRFETNHGSCHLSIKFFKIQCFKFENFQQAVLQNGHCTRCSYKRTRLHSQLLNYYLQPRTTCMGTDLEPSPTCVQKHVATCSLNVESDVCV
jgi:hypothetical protein